MFYAVVTFGTSPKQKVFTRQEQASSVARNSVGIGSCTNSRVYQCDTRELAESADISQLRNGERIVASYP